MSGGMRWGLGIVVLCGGEVLVSWMNLVSWGNGFEGVGIVDKVRLEVS